MTQQSNKELTLSLQRLKKQLHRIRYTKIREAQLFLMNNKLLDNDKALVARLESLMTEVRNNIYLPNYDFELVADNLSAAESIVVDLCDPIDFDE